MSKKIAYDISTEIAKRIADDARSSDKLNIVVYFLRNACCDDENEHGQFVPLFKAWRYQSSKENQISIKGGNLGHFLQTFVINSQNGLRSFISPPGNNYAELDLLYIIFAGDHDIPESFAWPKGKCLHQVVEECFPFRALDNFVDMEQEDCIESFLEDKLAEFVWNILC